MDQVPFISMYQRLAEVHALRAAIRLHRDGKAHARCWLDDQVLYTAHEMNFPILPLKARGESSILFKSARAMLDCALIVSVEESLKRAC
jgi:hypothetical protein